MDDACCMKCRLASISLLAPAEHVGPCGSTSSTAMTGPYLSGRQAHLQIDGSGHMMVMSGDENLPLIYIST